MVGGKDRIVRVGAAEVVEAVTKIPAIEGRTLAASEMKATESRTQAITGSSRVRVDAGLNLLKYNEKR